MVYPEMAVAEGASVVPLEVKLEELGGSDIADGWFCRAVSVLRGATVGSMATFCTSLWLVCCER